jgi:hypothetical protein
MIPQTYDIKTYRAQRAQIEPQPYPVTTRIRSALGVASLTAPTRYSAFAFGPDLSHYDTGTLAEKLVKYRGVDFIIAKIGGSEDYRGPYIDDRWNDHAQLAYDLPNPQGGWGVPLIGYWFANPRTYLEGQMSMEDVKAFTNEAHPVMSKILQALHNGAGWKQLKGFYQDYEEASYWITAPWKMNDTWMTFYMEDIFDRLRGIAGKDKTFPKMRQGVYSRKSFVDLHDTSVNSVQQYLCGKPDYDIWSASYPREVSNALSVAEIKRDWLPLDGWNPYQFGSSPKRSLPVALWQFAGDVDWNVAMQTPAEMYKRLGFTPRGIVDPPPPPVDPPPTDTDYTALEARVAEIEKRLAAGLSVTGIAK